MGKQKKQDILPEWMRQTLKHAEYSQRANKRAERIYNFFERPRPDAGPPKLSPKEKKKIKFAKRKKARQEELKLRAWLERDKGKDRFKIIEID